MAFFILNRKIKKHGVLSKPRKGRCMVAPLVILGVVIIAGLVFGGGTATWVYWDEILVSWEGKKVAVLGSRAVGKTCLIKFLSEGTIPESYVQTVASKKTKPRRFNLEDLDLKIKESLDVSGSKDAYALWKEIVSKADIVMYLMRADRLIAGDVDVEKRIKADLNHISEWMEERSPRPDLFLIGTHCDLDQEYNTLTEDKVGDYQDRFSKLPIMRDLICRCGGKELSKIILGSLKTQDKTEKLVYYIFSQAKK